MRHIMSMDTIPSTINNWYKKAISFQTQWECANEISKQNIKPTHQSYQSFSTPTKTRDPDAMDIDVIKVRKLTTKEHKKCIKKGLGFLLRLGTPNSVLTDLVVFLLLLYLIRLTYDSHAVSMFLFPFHIMPHALLTLFISVQCMAMSSFLLFHSATTERLPHALLRFHFMAAPDERFYLMLLGSGIS